MANVLLRSETGWLLRNGAVLGGMRMVNIAAGLATTVLLARVLGAESYGIYAFALGWVMILGMPMQMGLPTLVMRHVAVYRSGEDYQRLRGIVRWSFRLAGLSALGTALTCGAAAAYLQASGRWPTTATPILVSSAFALLCLLTLLSVYRAIISGFEDVVSAYVPDTLVRPVLFLLAIATTTPFLALDAGTVMALHALAALGATLLARPMAAHRLAKIEGDGTGGAMYETRAWLVSLWPLTVQSGSAMINSRLDIAMIGTLSGPLAVANYDIGLKIASFSLIVQSILLPLAVAQFARLNESRDLQAISRMCAKIALLGSIPILIFLLALTVSGTLVQKLFGSEFDQAQSVAIILTLGYLLNTLSGPAVHVLNMTGLEFRSMQFIIVAAILNFGLNLVFIPAYGPIGAAIATAASGGFLHLALMLFSWKLLGVATHVFAWSRRSSKI